MAIYSLRVQTIARSHGRSVVAAAAYRSGARLVDQRLDMEFDFSRKEGGVAHALILAPDSAPREFFDRERLWNAAEAADRRKDSVPAQEILIALPHELDEVQRRQLVETFARESLVARGMIADVAIHRPSREGDDRNDHAHILVTTRNVGPAGFGKKNPEWNKREFVTELRREWAQVLNRHLEQFAPGVAKVSELSLAEQGSDREPTEHLGPEASALERRGEATGRGENNRDIEAQNAGLAAIDRKLDREVGDAWRAGKWSQRPTDDVIQDMESVRAEMVLQRDRWRKDRDEIEFLRPTSLRKLEAELTREAYRDFRSARQREEAAKARARANGLSAKRIALWISNPSQALLKTLVRWNKDLDQIAKARGERERAKRALETRRAWTKSDAGRAHIDNLRQPQLEAAAKARSQRRTLDRKIKRMEKRIENAERDIIRTKVAKRLGVEHLETPKDVPTAAGRGGANARRYFRFMSAHARIEVGRMPDEDVKVALKFIRSLAPGASIPVRPTKTPDLPPMSPTGGTSRARDLPDLPDF
ncbi:MAG: MobQ family relaxase [Pseudomonadota bacterium]|jgi:hypothetical protein